MISADPGKRRSCERVLAVSGLSKTYPNGTRALCEVDLSLNRDEFAVVLGPSGAGKSTLLRCVNRLVEPSSGSVSFMGEEVTRMGGAKTRRLRARIGMIFQQFNLVRRLSVIENVLAGRLSRCGGVVWRGLSLLKVFPRKDWEVAFECLRKLRIESLAYQRADTLSGGQQQRVAIARTLAQEPELILADEPVASLDPASAEIVMQSLQEIHETQGIPVVVNLHQIELGCRYGKRVVGMKAGRVCFDGSPAGLDKRTLSLIYGQELESGLGLVKRRSQERERGDARELVPQFALQAVAGAD